MNPARVMITVYERPTDFEDTKVTYVLRPYRLEPSQLSIGPIACLCRDACQLAQARATLRELGFVRIEPDKDDDPVILEIWL